MDRRSFLASLVAAVLSSSVGGKTKAQTQPPARQERKDRRPNVVLLMADQHKRSCMGAYGDTVARTPNLDQLAAASVRFSSAYCNNPICDMRRITGFDADRSLQPSARGPGNTTSYLPTHPTIAHHFDQAAYMTALIGKMHFVDAQTHGFEYRLDFNDWLPSPYL